jgi:NDP-sugar pyrophosphorylase family protein
LDVIEVYMQIVIPMSGFGERFRNVGYKVPKPLIRVEGKSIIEHVIYMFPGETDFIFICNKDYLDDQTFEMRKILLDLCPTAQVLGVDAHKLGPVHTIQQAAHLLDMTKIAIVNYCDFTCYWNWSRFKEFVGEAQCKGVIPAYKGFHPHSLGNTNYAYIKEINGWMSDIQEKKLYTDNKMDEFASSGTCYFASAEVMSKALNYVVDEDLAVNSEYYVGLAYKYLFKTNQSVAVYPLQHFMQWGTPDDVSEYKTWSQAFHSMIKLAPSNTVRRGLH